MVCHREPQRAIAFAGHVLCSDCESRIGQTSVYDPEYAELVQRMREFWHGLAEAAVARD